MNRLYPHPIIAREGWPFIGGGLVLSLLVSACCGWWSLPFWIFTVFALQFFRDPAREIPQDLPLTDASSSSNARVILTVIPKR